LEIDSPHGANQEIEVTAGTVKEIRGRVIDPNGEPFNEVVVELYDYADADQKLGASALVETKDRRAACLTDKNGYFCFTNLKSGRYALRAGTRDVDGMNELFVKVRLERRWWIRWLRSGKDIELMLQPGT
jgi:uncharacterized GH25 family protein